MASICDILPSDGALENLQRLRNPKFKVDVGFVQGGLATEEDRQLWFRWAASITSRLGVFALCAPVRELSQLSGKRLAIGPEGSGTRVLVSELLKANGWTRTLTQIAPAGRRRCGEAALRTGKADAAFLMGDSARMQLVRS